MGLHVVTFDLFSALVDSRTGGSAVLGALAAERGWDVDGGTLYDRWDARNKASQRDLRGWVPFAEHSRRALAAAYADLGIGTHTRADGGLGGGMGSHARADGGMGSHARSDAEADAAALLGSVGDWPLWPDVEAGLHAVAARHRVGILSNVDDEVFARTRVGALVGGPVDAGAVLTSERLRAYKPDPELYLRARERVGGRLTHVATSARDVRGALEAGLDVVRLRRPGHLLDPSGPRPAVEVADLNEVVTALDRVQACGDNRGKT